MNGVTVKLSDGEWRKVLLMLMCFPEIILESLASYSDVILFLSLSLSLFLWKRKKKVKHGEFPHLSE